MRERSGASRELSLIKLGGLIHRQTDDHGQARCAYCSTALEYGEDVYHNGTIDHVWAKDSEELKKANIGWNDPRNLICACRSCNAIKGNGTQEELLSLKEHIESLGHSWEFTIQQIADILATPLNREFGFIYADTLYPKRREAILGHPPNYSTAEAEEDDIPF